MTTFVVETCRRVGVSGGYSVAWTRVWRAMGKVEIPLIPRGESGDIERR